MKKDIALILIFTVIFNILSPISISAVDENPDRFIDFSTKAKAFVAIMDVPKSSTGIAYRTIGIRAKARVQDKNSTLHEFIVYQSLKDQKVIEEYLDVDGNPWVKTEFRITRESLFENLKTIYPKESDRLLLKDFFADEDSIMILDALITTVVDGSVQGEVLGVGEHLSDVVSKGSVVDNFRAFCGLSSWSRTTLKTMEKQYFNQGVYFEPILFEKPIAKITDQSDLEQALYTYQIGQAIDLTGRNSDFRNASGVNRKYKWEFKKASENVNQYKTMVGDADLILDGKLEPIKYDVRLTISEQVKRWDDTLDTKVSDPVTCQIEIKKNFNPLTNAIVTSPPEIMLADTQNSVSIPVTLNTEVLNVEQIDILSVELQLSTYEKDQKRSQFFYPSLHQSMTHNFTIPYSGDPKTQIFEGKAIVTLKGGGIIESPIARSLTYLYKANNNLPPVAIIRAPNETLTGNVFISGSNSYDLDGHIVLYDFGVPGIGFYQSDTKSFCFPDFNRTGIFQVILGVTDDDGARSETGTFIRVTPPPPSIELSSMGFYKENRKITLKAMNWTESMSPVGENYHWTINPMDVTNPQSNIKMVSAHGSQIDVLMKVKGKYLVTCTGTNGYGVSDTKTMILDVKQDEAPVMVIDSTNPQFRDSTRMATITAYDHSYSTDGDFIKSRTWSYRFDSDNDGLFTDESSIVLKSTQDYIDNVVKFDVGSVGKYEITLSVTESFGQETIPSFITQADYETGTIKHVVTVDNYKPVVNFMAVNEKKIDLKIITDYEGTDLLDLEGKLNALVNEGYDQFLNINYEVISGKKYLGRYMSDDASGYYKVENQDTEKYAVANWAYGLTEYSDLTYTVSYTTYGRWPEDATFETTGRFPAKIKKSVSFGHAAVYLLENKQLYFLGTNSDKEYGSKKVNLNNFATSPYCVAYDVEDIQSSVISMDSGTSDPDSQSKAVFIRKTNGDIYVSGCYAYYSSGTNMVTQIPNPIKLPVNTVGDGYSTGVYSNSMAGGYTGIAKIESLSNIEYMDVVDRTVIMRTKTGNWIGLGAKLSRFGYPTMLPYETWKVTYRRNLWGLDETYYHYEVQPVPLKNLTNLDKAIGGIAKVEPLKAYGKNGKVYNFELTQHTIVGITQVDDIPDGIETSQSGYYDSYYVPLQELSPSEFTYSDSSETWGEIPPNISLEQFENRYISSTQILTEGVDKTPYLEYIEEPLEKTIKITKPSYVPAPIIKDVVVSKWLSPLGSKYFEYRFLSYVIGYPYTHKVYNPSIRYKSDGETYYTTGWDYYYDVIVKDKVFLGVYPYQAGWKAYGVDASKLKNTTYRTGSNKYILYFGKEDAFKKVSNDLENFIKDNAINVKVATKTDYLDDTNINKNTEIDLRGLVNALPTGKLYPINSDDSIAQETAVDHLLSDILSENKIKMAPDGGTYVILGEDTITYEKFYRDIENDPKLSENSKAIHNKDYYKNSMGLSVYHNQILTLPLTTFDKVGQYEIEYKATDQPSTNYRLAQYNRTSDPATLKVYVHRRPVADFDIERDYEASLIDITLKNQSYDLDHQGEIHDGIVSSEWSYKLGDQTTWQSGMPTSANYGDTLEIALTVTDLEGATSSRVKSYTMPEAIPLFLSCELKPERIEFDKNAIPASESLRLTNIIVSRAIPHGIEINLKSNDGSISQKYTEYTNSNTTTYTDANGMRTWHDTLITLPATYKDGGYKVEVKLKDLKNADGTSYQLKTGDQVSKTLDFKIITPVKLNASIAAQSGNAYDLKGITGRYSKETTVKLFSGTSYEKTISLPKTSETHKTNHLLDEATWLRNVKVIATDVATGTPAPTGRYMARFETKTASGNRAVSEVPFDYQTVIVKSFDARGYWNHWRGQTTLKGEVTTIEPHRFLSHECVIFEALIEGEIEEALLRLSPELESMTYWDKYNNVYRYEDDFYMKVYFPIHLKRVQKTAEGDLWQYEYALPYADSTQSYDNERLKPSYKATLYVIPKGVDWHGDYTTEGLIKMEIEDIDITGNIYDLLYIEPVRGNVSEMSQ